MKLFKNAAFKKTLAIFSCAALLFSLGITAFADAPSKPNDQDFDFSSSATPDGDRKPDDAPQFNDYGSNSYGFGGMPYGEGNGNAESPEESDDIFMIFGKYFDLFEDEDFDVDDFLEDLDDEDLSDEIKDLFKAYYEAYDEYLDAYEKLYLAADALITKLDDSSLLDDADTDVPDADADSQVQAPQAKDENTKSSDGSSDEPSQNSSSEPSQNSSDVQSLFDEFLSWYNSKNL